MASKLGESVRENLSAKVDEYTQKTIELRGSRDGSRKGAEVAQLLAQAHKTGKVSAKLVEKLTV